MNTQNPRDRDASRPSEEELQSVAKKPYRKPAFRHERVFETMALICGKISGTQGACASSKKTS